MKKLINDKNNIVEEVVQGMIKAFPDKVSRVENEPIIIRKNKKVNKVALISGGGSGEFFTSEDRYCKIKRAGSAGCSDRCL